MILGSMSVLSSFVSTLNLSQDLLNFNKNYRTNFSDPYTRKWFMEYEIKKAEDISVQNEENNAIIRGEKKKKEKMISEIIPLDKPDEMIFDNPVEGILQIFDGRYLTLNDSQRSEYLKTFMVYIHQLNNSQKDSLLKDFYLSLEKKRFACNNDYQLMVLLYLIGSYLEINIKVGERVIVFENVNAWLELDIYKNKLKVIQNSIIPELELTNEYKKFIPINKKNTIKEITEISLEFNLPIKKIDENNKEIKLKKEELIINLYN